MNVLTKSLIALSFAGLLLGGCGKKEEQVSAPAVIEQSAEEASAAAEEAKTEAERAVEAAKEAAESN